MNELPSILVFTILRNFLIRCNAWSLYCALRQKFSTCLLKVRFLSVFIPSSITSPLALTTSVITQYHGLKFSRVCWVNLMTFNFSTKNKISLINMLNSNRPNSRHCVIPQNISVKLRYEVPILVLFPWC